MKREQQAEQYAREKKLDNDIALFSDKKEIFLAGYDAAVKDMGWRKVEDELPEEGDNIWVSFIYIGRRQYHHTEYALLEDGKLVFGDSICDYWLPAQDVEGGEA